MADKADDQAKAPNVKTYILANVIFWTYLVVMLLIAAFIVRDTSGVTFVLSVLGVTFTLISIADFFSERAFNKAPEAE